MNPLDLQRFRLAHFTLAGRDVGYEWGIEVPLTIPLIRIRKFDCSEYIENLFGRQGIFIPDGSVNQREWFKQNCREVPFSGVISPYPYGAGQSDNRFFIGGWNYGGTRRHISGFFAGWTYECRSGDGVSSRPAGEYGRLIQWCVEVPTI